MSGHSKWANIRVRKDAQDAKRGKAYTKYARLIEIAAREGGGDPLSNVRLRSLIDAAKAESVPNANIDRAIQKGTGALKGDAMAEITYEAYLPLRSSVGAEGGGPSGPTSPEGLRGASSAFIIECLTDNKNRTLSNVKMIISKNGGRFAESGSVTWMFQRAGVVTARNEKLKIENEKLRDDLELQLIDAGADDIVWEGDAVQVTSEKWSVVRDFLSKNGFSIESAGLKFMPKQTVEVDAQTMLKVETLIDALEEDDDVSEVSTNARQKTSIS